jgi:hypothetical protein
MSRCRHSEPANAREHPQHSLGPIFVVPPCHGVEMHSVHVPPPANSVHVPPENGLLYRSDLLRAGYTPSAIRHRLTIGEWDRLFEGVYIRADISDEDKAHASNLAWLHRAGAQAVLSHATAAAFHGFDSTDGWPTDTMWITHPMTKRMPETPGYKFVRSRTMTTEQTHHHANELRYTSRSRTLLDMLSMVDLVEGERVLESALRGPNPMRPDVWRPEVLMELVAMIKSHPRQPGAHQAQVLLAQRPIGCRPTGSIAETAGLQALRGGGFANVVRQPRVIAEDEHGNPREHFLDLFVDDEGYDIEIDGNQHLEKKQNADDKRRDRRLAKGMGVLRFTAGEALNHPDRIVASLREEIERQPHEQLMGTRTHSLEGHGHERRIVRRQAVA